MQRPTARLAGALLLTFALGVEQSAASFHLWQVNEVFSCPDASVQFVELATTFAGQQFLSGHQLRATSGADTHTFTFPSNSGSPTNDHALLIATAGFETVAGVAPDFTLPAGFVFTAGGTVELVGAATSAVTHGAFVDGVASAGPGGGVNSPRNFAGVQGNVVCPPTTTSTTTTPGATTTSTTLQPLCVDGAAIGKPTVALAKLDPPAGNEKLVLSGVLQFAAGTPTTFDPAATGVQILLDDVSTGTRLLDLTRRTAPVPPGAPGTACGPKDGWKGFAYRNRSGALDPPTCTPGSANGLKRIVFKDRRARGKGIVFTVKASGATLAQPGGPLRVTVVLGALEADGLAGKCGLHAFTVPDCGTRRAAVRCR